MANSKMIMRNLAIALSIIAFLVLATTIWSFTLMSDENDTSSWNIVEPAGNNALAQNFSEPAEEDAGAKAAEAEENVSLPTQTMETEEETGMEPGKAASPPLKEPERYIVNKHMVVGGESFSVVTHKYWDDYFLWPDLYIRNEMLSDDPDLIYPYEVIDIYNRLGNGNNFTDVEKSVILDSYIKVYRRFKALGPRKNSSAWTLLWCATKYDRDFLDKYADKIDAADIAKTKEYIAEEGYLD